MKYPDEMANTMNTKNKNHDATRPLRVGIVGCGWVAGSQIERGFSQLRDRFTVAACCDADHARAEDFALRHGIEVVSEDFAALLAEDLDVISICTPPSLHHSMVLGALAAGKHVICEKPFTSSLRLMDQVIAAEAASDRRIMPIFQYRFDDGIAKVRSLIASGLCGKAYLSSVETAWLRGADYYDVPWRGKFATELGGVLLTQSIHIHDLFLWLMGPAAQINGFKTTRVNPIEVEDCAVASVQMADGSLATLSATLGSALPVTRIRLCFENLVIERQCFGTEAKNPGAEPWTITARTPDLQAHAERIMSEAHLGPRDFAGQFADFATALAEDRAFAVTLQDARRSLELISAVFHAAETGQTVQLPITADHVRYDGWAPSHE
ncbi:Gfo/Idh/MocA family protein [Roseicitreum antarcticum]|uniref:Predicted dehydrogenase n=1 Tax=Roseicitreum antarcticum TaxID=564137 RepID=A0A1H2YL13_9RHOB|nr:Gfo/Idh/MocA family oxidoreductase [Roseicitreum antarcticum]SDX05681.1 Predicted dehydrogenase [Roseicitreum antarcticum]